MTTASVQEVREKGFGEKAEKKLASCETLSGIMGLDEEELKFNDKLGSSIPSQTSLKEERIEFSSQYLADRRENSFEKFQDALMHEVSHLYDIKKWKEENVTANSRFIKLFKFFSEGLASQFDSKESSYPATERFFSQFYEQVTDPEESRSPGELLVEKADEVEILYANYRMDDSKTYDFQVVENFGEEMKDKTLYRKAQKEYQERYPGRDISLIEEKSERISIKEEEAEVLAQHYKKVYEGTKKILSEYIDEVEKVTGEKLERYVE